MSWLTDVGEDVLTLILEECDSGSLVALSATCQTLYSTIRSKEQRLSMKQITAMTDFFVLVDAGAVDAICSSRKGILSPETGHADGQVSEEGGAEERKL